MQEQILAAFDKTFDRTIRLAHEPKADFFKNYSLGYHDDSFAYQPLTPPDWHYQGKLARYGETERLRTQQFGGEDKYDVSFLSVCEGSGQGDER